MYSQALRYKRISSEPQDCNLLLAKLQQGFRQLGYKHDLIDSQIYQALQIPRKSLLQYRPKIQCNRTPLA